MAAGWVAIALAFVVVLSVASLLLLYLAAGPFGFINDLGNGVIGVLSLALAILLVGQAAGWAGVVVAAIGAAITVVGSWLVITGTTGFLLAGFVSTIGFGVIGAWLALVAWGPMADEWSSLLRSLARIAAATMIAGGLAAIPGALMRIDRFEDVPGWMWLFSLGWLGVYVLYPIVAFGVGRRLIGQ
jgi:hypothetical protein